MSAFQKIEHPNLLLLKAEKSALHKEDEVGLEQLIKMEIAQPTFSKLSGLVVDLGTVLDMTPGFARVFASQNMVFRKQGFTFFLIVKNASLKNYLKNVQGLSMPIFLSLGELEEKVLGAKKKSVGAKGVNVEFLGPFVDAAVKTLKVQCSIEVSSGKPFLKSKENKESYSIAGSIGLTSQYFNGSISLCFSKEVFLKIMGNMLGEDYTEIDDELEDGAGELLNIIFGQAKISLNEKGYKIEKAIPTVIRGNSIEVRHLTSEPTLVIPFKTEFGSFNIEIGMDPSNEGGKNV